jgi:hypothetical protein
VGSFDFWPFAGMIAMAATAKTSMSLVIFIFLNLNPLIAVKSQNFLFQWRKYTIIQFFTARMDTLFPGRPGRRAGSDLYSPCEDYFSPGIWKMSRFISSQPV